MTIVSPFLSSLSKSTGPLLQLSSHCPTYNGALSHLATSKTACTAENRPLQIRYFANSRRHDPAWSLSMVGGPPPSTAPLSRLASSYFLFRCKEQMGTGSHQPTPTRVALRSPRQVVCYYTTQQSVSHLRKHCTYTWWHSPVATSTQLPL